MARSSAEDFCMPEVAFLGIDEPELGEADFGLSAFDPALDCVFVGVLRMTSMSLRSCRGCEVRMTSPESVS